MIISKRIMIEENRAEIHNFSWSWSDRRVKDKKDVQAFNSKILKRKEDNKNICW